MKTLIILSFLLFASCANQQDQVSLQRQVTSLQNDLMQTKIQLLQAVEALNATQEQLIKFQGEFVTLQDYVLKISRLQGDILKRQITYLNTSQVYEP